MADWKPKLDWLKDPDIHRQELIDLTPPDSPNREQFVDALVSHLYCTRIRPGNVQAMKSRAKGNPLAKEAKVKLDKVSSATWEAAQAIREWITATSDPGEVSRTYSLFGKDATQIRLLVSQMMRNIDALSLGVPEDGREKKMELRLVEEVLALWMAHFPEHPLPAKAMQGRTKGRHEPCRPARLCQLVLEFMTGIDQKDISRLYEQAVEELDGIEQTTGTITLPL